MTQVRVARAADHHAIVEFTRGTFSWGDYVGDRFLDWLGEPDSQVHVATDANDTVIGVARVAQLTASEIWLSAARVHPDHRRKGIGGALNAAAVEWGRTRGAVVAGLMTEENNLAAQGKVAGIGYRQVAHWFYAARSLEPGERDPGGVGLSLDEAPQPLTVAPAVDIEPAYLTWAASELATAAHGMMPLGWAMRRMSIEDLVAAVRQGSLYEAPCGWAVISQDGEGRARVPWLVTIPDDAYSFVRAITARIAADGYHNAGLMLPKLPWLMAAAERAGYELHPNIVWHLQIK